ncbi:hypothetical protein KFZ76_09445 [Methylovulum psychrotolerans]|uniref:hypothetical protein n=1 Tax=Methylovulum psychrotolerans TaxID=1704499 RepID=UPI001BFF4EBA|nr:hypothetical protein [Methylovulum psychrotolerans]MBT9097926.1 hypothetical protein [Methylovulum psychrotolerans]
MNKSLLLLLVLSTALPTAAQAEEVFKCVVDNKTVYQFDPCPTNAAKKVEIDIKQEDPAKEAEAQAKLQTWEQEFKKREAAEQQAQRERQAELDRQAAIAALNRNAIAQEELAAAARQRNIYGQPLYGGGYRSPYYNNMYPGGFFFGGGGYPTPQEQVQHHSPEQHQEPTRRALAR